MEDSTLSIKPDISQLLTNISRFLAEEGVRAYLVGGFVRDMLLGRDTADVDVAIAANALEIAPEVASAFGGRYIPLDEENGIGRVILFNNGTTPDEGKRVIDFSTLKGNIEQDLAQRDFTIDAMAVDLERITPKAKFSLSMLIDPFNGRDNLRRGLIRAVSENAFKSDAARLIRAVRLAAELGFSIDSETETLIRQHSHLITGVAGERVREELLRLLAIPQAGQRLAYLDKLGILTAMMPELVPARGVSQPKVHVWDVFDHSLQTVAAVEFLLREGTWEHISQEILASVPWSDSLSHHFDREVSHGSTRRSLLKLAALLHDIAKPQTKTVDEDGRARFLGHPQEGAATAASILERLRFSTKEIRLVELVVRYHLRPTQMSHDELPSRRAIYRYFRDTGEAGIDILFLSLADHLATRGSYLDLAQWQEHARTVEYVLTRHLEEESLSAPPKLIDGHDIIKILGLSPGPRVGELLEALREAQAAGEVTTREAALNYIKHLLTKQG
jgi:poly(A) polymerase